MDAIRLAAAVQKVNDLRPKVASLKRELSRDSDNDLLHRKYKNLKRKLRQRASIARRLGHTFVGCVSDLDSIGSDDSIQSRSDVSSTVSISSSSSSGASQSPYSRPLLPLETPTQRWERELHQRLAAIKIRYYRASGDAEEIAAIRLKLEYLRVGGTHTQYHSPQHSGALPSCLCFRNVDMKTMVCKCHSKQVAFIWR
jgi:hypothetical protein